MARSDHATHLTVAASCWQCLSPSEQARSRQVWQGIASDPRLGFTDDPDFKRALTFTDREVEAGRCIELHRPEQEGARIIIPYSLFWYCVEVIHDEQKQRMQ